MGEVLKFVSLDRGPRKKYFSGLIEKPSNHDFYSQKTSFIIPQISSEYNSKLISCQVQNPYTRLYNNTGNSAPSQITVYCKQSPILNLNFFRKKILHKSMIS